MIKNLLLELSSNSKHPTNLKSFEIEESRTEVKRVHVSASREEFTIRKERRTVTERTRISYDNENKPFEGSGLLQFLQHIPNRIARNLKWQELPVPQTELIDVDSSDNSEFSSEMSSEHFNESQKHTVNETELRSFSYEKVEQQTTMLKKREPEHWMSDQPLRLVIGSGERAKGSAEKFQENVAEASEGEESESEGTEQFDEGAKGYAANSDKGNYRNYNEDRIVVVLNVPKPAHFVSEYWPKCSYYAIFDGHGGSNCAEFLKNHLHRYILKHESFPADVEQAIQKGFETAENEFCKDARADSEEIDFSGSCALVVIVVANICYIANLGDSRAVGSFNFGESVRPLSIDHNPDLESERSRIVSAGGQLYQTSTKGSKSSGLSFTGDKGAVRVIPGGLNVSRTIGDINAKLPELGGKPGVTIPLPEIKTVRLEEGLDFILMGSDGIFHKVANEELCRTCWKAIEAYKHEAQTDLLALCLKAVEDIMISCLAKKTRDNISLILISFRSLQQLRGDHYRVRQETMTMANTKRLVNGSVGGEWAARVRSVGNEEGGLGCYAKPF